ncbi:MAG: substrate-binding domain-containing protein [Bifidobacteriaceae bacterium]|jgi:ABC-type sugar transport system substrate-binding protein|nr:substrate-binding domain-containing protein [Bifidobacteriaceae bacterium]
MHRGYHIGRVAGLAAAAVLAGAIAAGCAEDEGPDVSGTATDDAASQTVRIAFIGESSSTDVIWSYRAARMREEAQRNGAEFVDRYAEGDYAAQARMIEEEVARGANAIIAPFFDPTAANDAIKAAVDKGVAVYALLGVPDLEADYLAKIGQAPTDWADVGGKLAEVSLEAVPEGGVIVWPAEAPDGTYITDAVARYESVAADLGVDVTVEVIDVGSDPTSAASTILSYLTSHPDTAALATSGAIAIGAANTAMSQGGLQPGDPPLFGQVVSPASTNGLMEGFMPAGVNLELTESSYFAVQAVVAMVREGAQPSIKPVPLVVVTTDNVEETVPEELR